MNTFLKLGAAFLIIFNIIGCKTNQSFLAENANSALQMHRRVAVLPLKVTFNEEYKSISRGRGQGNWPEQERIAGLDLQKTTFNLLARRAEKKKWGITVQDFLTTNRTLQSENIRFSELKSIDKGKLARLLGVDAVIWGETEMQFSMRNFAGRNGMNTQLQLIDADSGGLLWQNQSFQDISNRMDSPQDLAVRAVQNLIGALPYQAQK
ncbi:hypothetical protein [Lacihabitans soyangensis]|uniref:Uncharacterized protein n=1 Tax=Lacihabitans soyangensis TaxID=869394 RepID=A0AAE3KW23_9BACT|nr:hypothetical protein [Lacihabitans soyangensis]MCP9764916.1 hypothetical protein [Lacihabitans soyangensis]